VWAGQVAPQLAAGPAAEAAGWRTETVEFTSTFVAVAKVSHPGSDRRLVVKIPWTTNGADKLQRQAEVLTALQLDSRLDALRSLIPRTIEQGEIDGRYYCVEEALLGVPATAAMARRAQRPMLLAAATAVITDFHRSTGAETVVDSASIDAWAHQPLRRLEVYAAAQRRPDPLASAIGRLHAELDAVLGGRTVQTSWIHGDFWHGNLLADAAQPDITGIVDWDGAAAGQLPLHDLLHLHVFARRLTHGDELGEIVVKAITGGIAETIGVSSTQVTTWLDGIPERAAILLYWLRHVHLFIDTEGHHDNPRWLRSNVESVLANV
jgi:aminoglycoside phosphotransferase (APT) family kinase protein